MAMNKGLQKHTVKKKLRNRGIQPEKIDLEAELDSSLTLTENIQNLENKYGKLQRTGRNFRGRQAQAQKQRRDQVKKEAKRINKKRPKYNRYVDATKTAETVYADPSERQFQKWKQNPNKYDIKGVDTRKNPSERPQTELPIQRNKNVIYRGSKEDLKKSMRKIPGSIKRNATGKINRIGEESEDRFSEIGPIVPSEDKLSSSAKKLIKKDRQRVMDKESMVRFEREERLQASSGSNASKILKDSREISDVGKNINGNTKQKSSQESLRDGYISKDSEKTLEKWDGNYI